MAGIRQWFHGLTSTAPSGSRIHKPSTVVAIAPTPAHTSAVAMPAREAITPHAALPNARPPWVTSRNTERTRARTHAGASVWTSTLVTETTAIHAAPATSNTAMSAGTEC